MSYLTEELIETDTHVTRAVDMILDRVRNIVRKDGEKLLTFAAYGMLTRENVAASKTPYLLARIIDVTPVRVNTSMRAALIEQELAEIALSVVFASPRQGNANPQKIGEGVRQMVLNAFRPKEGAWDTDGWDLLNAGADFWRFSSDTNFKAKLTKGVSDPIVMSQLGDPLYSLPIQFKLQINSTTPLPPLQS